MEMNIFPRTRTRLLVAAIAICFADASHALPVGPQIAAGSASFNQTGNALTINNSNNAILNWKSFNIAAQEAVRFNQPSASSSVLNRVLASDPSSLLGQLSSNGRVWLVNPAGILVGPGAHIDTAGFVASTLNVRNEDFLAGRLNFQNTPGAGSVVNQGSISTPGGGSVYLIAPDISNEGIISTPQGETILAAGQTVQLLDTATPGVKVEVTGATGNVTNLGSIVADAGRIGMVGALVRNSGNLNASSVVNEGGRIFLKASKDTIVDKDARVTASGSKGGSIEVLGNRVAVMDDAQLDASGQQGGGSVLIGGDYQGKNPDIRNSQVTYLGANAEIKANAVKNGDGGKVIVWADDTARAYGSISVRGGDRSGDGGFVETSGHRYLDVTRAPDLSASAGKGGAWLLDPENITISGAASSNISGTATFAPAAAGSSVLSDAVLRAALVAGGVVTVDTTGGAGATGNILVDATASLTNINAGPSAMLNLKAHNDITINSSITATTNPLSMSLIADQDSNSTGAVYINKSLLSNNGNISITAFGNIALNDGTTTNINAGTGTVSLTSSGGSIQGDPAGGVLDVSAASMQLNAATGISANGGAAAFYVDAGSIGFSNSGTQLVRIYNNHAGASSFTTSSTGGPLVLESFDVANPTSVGNITAGGNVVLRINNLNIAGPINAGSNSVNLAPFTPNSPVSIGGNAAFDLTGAELSNITAAKIVVGDDTFGNFASTATIGANAAVGITNLANLEVVAPSITTGAIGFTNTGGSLALTADSMTLGGGLNVGSGMVWLKGKTSGQNIDLGGADSGGTLGLTIAELNQINAATLRIGSLMGTGAMNVSTAINPSGITTLSIESGGNITQAASMSITATNLAVRSFGNVALDTVANTVGNLAASIGDPTHQNKDFRFKNNTALNVGANIDGASGISTNIDAVGFNPASPNGVIVLASGSTLSQSAGALLGGKAVYAEGVGVALNNANPTGMIAGKAIGNGTGQLFQYSSSNGINATTVNGFSGIQTASPSDAASVLLTAGSAGISQDPGALINAGAGTKGLMLSTAGPVNLVSTANSVGALATGAPSPSQLHFVNSGPMTIGITGNGIATNNGPVNVSAGGLLTVQDGVSAGSGSIALEAANIQLGAPSVAGAAISGGFIKLRANQPSTGAISMAATTTASTINGSGIVLEADNFPLTVSPLPVFTATNDINYRTVSDNVNISVSALGGATNNAPWLVLGNDIASDTNTTGSITVDTTINRPTGGVVLLAGGGITQSAAITAQNLAFYAGTVAGAAGVTLTLGNQAATVAGTTNGGAISFSNASALNVGTVSDGTHTASGLNSNNGAVTLKASAGNITLSSPIAAGSGAIVLDAGNAGFTNNAGATPMTTSGRWLVYAANPSLVNKSGLTSSFRHYNATSANYFTPGEAGNGFIYASAPGGLTVNTTLFSGVASNTYGQAPTAVYGYTLAGTFDKEDISGTPTFTPVISTTTSAGGYTISYAEGLTSASSFSGSTLGTPVSYSFVPGTGLAYTINTAALSIAAALTGTTSKTYDGTTTAILTPGNFLLSGFVGADSASVTKTIGTYVSKNVGSNVQVSTALVAADFSAGGGTNLANYSLPSSATGNIGTITPASVSVGGILANDKVYNATTVATLNVGTATLAGVISGDSVAIGAASGSFADKNVGTAKSVTISGLSLSGADAGNYTLSGSTAGTTANITPASVSVGGILANDKVYDATTAATLKAGTATLAGVRSGDSLALGGTASGSFADKNVGTAKPVTISGLSLSGADAGNYTLSGSSAGSTASITPASISVSGIKANNKGYDATTAATLDSSMEKLVGIIAGDSVDFAGNASASFADKNVGSAKPVTVSGITLIGADVGNYLLSSSSVVTSADITPASLSVSGLKANDKVYDATTAATLNAGTAALAGVLSGDSVALGGTASGSFADKNVGTAKPVTISGLSLSGADAGNYKLSGSSASSTANITPASVSVSGILANDKVYDATTVATLNVGTATLAGVISGDSVAVGAASSSFADKNVGTSKPVTISGLSLSGADAGNYVLGGSTAGTTANITPAGVSVSGILANDKVYDATTVATINAGTATLAGVIGGDSVAVGGTAAGSFTDKNVGLAKPVTISGLTLSGVDAGNYALSGSTAGTMANITPAGVSVSGILANDKVYDATAVATLNTGTATLAGVLGGDSVALGGTATGSFTDKNVGLAKPVTISGLTLSGADAGNYALSGSTAGSTANITPATISRVDGISASDKVYDGNTSATLKTGGATFAGMFGGDVLAVSGASGSFADKNAGTGKKVGISGIALAGPDAGNYTLADNTASSTANITPATIADVNGITANDKPYDGNPSATLNTGSATFNGMISGDMLAVGGASGSFGDSAVGTDKPVSIENIALAGTDAGNYTLAKNTASTKASITSVLKDDLIADTPVKSNIDQVVTTVNSSTQPQPDNTPTVIPPPPPAPSSLTVSSIPPGQSIGGTSGEFGSNSPSSPSGGSNGGSASGSATDSSSSSTSGSNGSSTAESSSSSSDKESGKEAKLDKKEKKDKKDENGEGTKKAATDKPATNKPPMCS